MKEGLQDTPREAELQGDADAPDDALREVHGEYLRLKEAKRDKDAVTYAALSLSRGQRVEWIEIETKSKLEDYERKIEEIKKLKYINFIQKIFKIAVTKKKIVIIAENRGEKTLREFLESASPLPEQLIRGLAKQIVEQIAWMEEMHLKSKIDPENVTISSAGRVFIHSSSIWKELLKLPIHESNAHPEEERARGAGAILLALGAGPLPEKVARLSRAAKTEEETDELQREIAELVLKIRSTCFKEVVMLLFSSPYTVRHLEEILALHFFYPEEECEDSCVRCGADRGDARYCEDALLGKTGKQIESVYDHLGGVAVKASTSGKDKFAFQMHFFKSSKSISFQFNKNEDTVESVVKEMKDEGLAEEQQAELIKAHMESLIVKIEEKGDGLDRSAVQCADKSLCESADGYFDRSSGADTANNQACETRAEIELQGGGVQSSAQLQSTPNQLFTPNDELQMPSAFSKQGEPMSPTASGQQSASSSDEGTEYPVTECRDSQSVSDFVHEVATYIKRSRSAAEGWTAMLKKHDIKTVGDLRVLVEEDWEKTKLPVFASRAMKNMLYGETYVPFKEAMLRVNESLKEYRSESLVEELLEDTVQKYSRPEMFNDWASKIACQDIRTVGELKLLREEDWEQLGLSVFSYRTVKNAVFRQTKTVTQRISMEDRECK